MNHFHQKKILVVGGAGFVGSNLVKRLLADLPSQILVVDNLLSAEKENLTDAAQLELLVGSITDDHILNELHDDFDYIFHLATFHGNQNSIADPLADHENNTLTTLKLFNHVREFKKLQKLVYASAGCVTAKKTFANAEATTEETIPSLHLDSPYQISKIIGEFYANYYYKQHQLPVVKARFQNVYGPGEVLGAGQWRGTSATVWRNVVPTFVYQALKQQALTVDNGGINTRDFIYVADIVTGLMNCAFAGQAGETYNLASGVETSIKMLADHINQLTNNPVAMTLRPQRAWDQSGTRYGSTNKAQSALNFRVEKSLIDGLTETIAWTRDNMAWIDACISKHTHHLS